MNPLRLLSWTLLCLAVETVLPAQVPQIINYQGRVTANGTSFNGVGQFNFSFVNGDGTQTYWQANGIAINVISGLFTVRLGDTSLPNMAAILPDVFTDPTHDDVRLRVAFNDGTHGFQTVTPDTRMLAVPYALSSKTAEFGIPANAQEFKEAGVFPFTVPPGVTKILAEVWGAGGGFHDYGYDHPGGCGAYSRKVINVTPGDALEIKVGEGGASVDVYYTPGNINPPTPGIRHEIAPAENGEESKICRLGPGATKTTLCISEGGAAWSEDHDIAMAAPDPNAAIGRSGMRVMMLNSGTEFISGSMEPPLSTQSFETGSGIIKHLSAAADGKIRSGSDNSVWHYLAGESGYVLLQW